jgi:hypothetical protein
MKQAARQIVKEDPELAQQIAKGDKSIAEAKKELRKRGQMKPAQKPRGLPSKVLPSNQSEKTNGSQPEQEEGHSPESSAAEGPPLLVPADSPQSLAAALMNTLGPSKAVTLLRDALALAEKQSAEVN